MGWCTEAVRSGQVGVCSSEAHLAPQVHDVLGQPGDRGVIEVVGGFVEQQQLLTHGGGDWPDKTGQDRQTRA